MLCQLIAKIYYMYVEQGGPYALRSSRGYPIKIFANKYFERGRWVHELRAATENI